VRSIKEKRTQQPTAVSENSIVAHGTGASRRKNERKNRIKGCAVVVKVIRSFNKTKLDVVTYDSMKRETK
jgi:hypothetical protein